MFTEAQGIMASAGMHLSKWKTNSDLVANKIFKESSGKYLESESVKVLGLGWQASSDSFDFTGFEVPSDLYVTKRVVLSIIARMFDPLGFLTPFIMKAKIIFQQLWQSGVGWDELAPQELREDFLHWVEGLKSICHLRIERRYFGSYAWSSLQGLEVHAFGDASEKGYGTVVYLRIPVGNKYRMSFVMARSRVAPIKKVTLPRLELLGALLTARTVGFVIKALSLSVTYKCWTDSMVVLSWIKGDPSKYKTFVGNRVREIHQIVDPSCWNHCPGKGNPAI